MQIAFELPMQALQQPNIHQDSAAAVIGCSQKKDEYYPVMVRIYFLYNQPTQP